MTNPFTKANPMLSLWLSAANTWGNTARGFWAAEFQRQQNAMMAEAMRQAMRFWTGAWMIPPGRAALAEAPAQFAAAVSAPLSADLARPHRARQDAAPHRVATRQRHAAKPAQARGSAARSGTPKRKTRTGAR